MHVEGQLRANIEAGHIPFCVIVHQACAQFKDAEAKCTRVYASAVGTRERNHLPVLTAWVAAYQVSDNIGVIALLQHLNLFLDFQYFILVTQGDDLDCDNLLCAPDLCLVH